MSSDSVAYALPIVVGSSGPTPGGTAQGGTAPVDGDAPATPFAPTLAHAIDGQGGKDAKPDSGHSKGAKGKDSKAHADGGDATATPAIAPTDGTTLAATAAAAAGAAPVAVPPVAPAPPAPAVVTAPAGATTPTVPAAPAPTGPAGGPGELAATPVALPLPGANGALAPAAGTPADPSISAAAGTGALATAAAAVPVQTQTLEAGPARAKDGVELDSTPKAAPSAAGASAAAPTIDPSAVKQAAQVVADGQAKAPQKHEDAAAPVRVLADGTSTAEQSPTMNATPIVATGAFTTPAAAVVVSSRLDHLSAVATAVMQTSARTGIGRARIDLRPAELGHVEIRLSYNADGVRATVTAQNADAVHALSSATGDLRRALEAQGLTVLALDVNHAGAEDRPRPDSEAAEQSQTTPGVQGVAGDEDDESDSTTEIQSVRVPAAGRSVDVLA